MCTFDPIPTSGFCSWPTLAESCAYLARIAGWDLLCGGGQQSGEVRNRGFSPGILADCSTVRLFGGPRSSPDLTLINNNK